MKVQVNEEEIMVECLINMHAREGVVPCLQIISVLLCTMIEATDLKGSGFNSADEAFDDFSKQTKEVYNEAMK